MFISKNKISIPETDDWCFQISEKLANIPEEWMPFIKESKFYSIIKSEFEHLTHLKSDLEKDPSLDPSAYKNKLVCVASACVKAMLEM